ncbi:hypothetical protein EVAR_49543_1 [Eumeta japonica]|uniref:Uncharacterized protein n=1 Tax=Eumeta variegata TaxID=151549 RepID=A0A4C1XK51_EUMVA|nr:hypothetical protein EVAR_49543_1 [Eumeta japonica]
MPVLRPPPNVFLRLPPIREPIQCDRWASRAGTRPVYIFRSQHARLKAAAIRGLNVTYGRPCSRNFAVRGYPAGAPACDPLKTYSDPPPCD